MVGPDRLYIDKADREIIEEIKKEKLFNFENINNKEKFLFAMSIGVNAGVDNYSIEKRDAFFLDKDLNFEDKVLMNACAIKKFGNIDVVEDKEKVYKYAEECAHLGFKLLINEIKQSGFGSFENQYNIKINDIYKTLMNEES